MKPIARGLTLLSVLTTSSLFGGGLVFFAQAQAFELSPKIIAQAYSLTTYMTVLDSNTVVIQISEGGEFFFHGYLERTSGNTFIGEDEQVRVIYDQSTKQVVVINKLTGDEFYNYYFSNVNEGAL